MAKSVKSAKAATKIGKKRGRPAKTVVTAPAEETFKFVETLPARARTMVDEKFYNKAVRTLKEATPGKRSFIVTKKEKQAIFNIAKKDFSHMKLHSSSLPNDKTRCYVWRSK